MERAVLTNKILLSSYASLHLFTRLVKHVVGCLLVLVIVATMLVCTSKLYRLWGGIQTVYILYISMGMGYKVLWAYDYIQLRL